MPCILSYLTSCGSNRLLHFKVAKFYATRAVLFYFALQLLSNQTIQRTFSKPTHFLSCSVIKFVLQTLTHFRYAKNVLHSYIKIETLSNSGVRLQTGAAELHQDLTPNYIALHSP
jgi:hypothetical protein